MESEILGSGIGNTAQGIRNLLTIRKQNPSSSDKDSNPVPGIRNPRRGIQSPKLSWISLHGGSSFVNTSSRGIYLFENMQCHYIFNGRYHKSITNTTYDKAKNTLSNSLGKNEVQTTEVFFKKIDVSFLRNLGVSRVW